MGDATAGREALLVMDMPPAVLAHVADAEVLLSRTRGAIAAASAAGLPVLHVVVRFRPGLPEISARNLAFSRVAERLGSSLDETGPDADVDPRVGREPSEPVAVKRRVDAFSGSDLDVLLRAAGVDHLVLSGVSTRASCSPPCAWPPTSTTGSPSFATAAPTGTRRSTASSWSASSRPRRP